MLSTPHPVGRIPPLLVMATFVRFAAPSLKIPFVLQLAMLTLVRVMLPVVLFQMQPSHISPVNDVAEIVVSLASWYI
jgi:hypothetical protein